MGLNKILKKIEKKYAWGFLGFLFAIIMAIWSIYVTYYRDLNPDLEFRVETNTKVLDLKENVRRLDIIYQGENIKENHKNLSVIKIRIQNPTQTNITINSYDLREPLGFRVNKGEIVEKPQFIESSSDYLKNNLIIKVDSLGQAIFSPVIIEGEDYFIIKLLVLHKQNETPEIIPFGKIAGVKMIRALKTFETQEKKSFWGEAIYGSLWIQVARFLFYVIIGSLIIGLAVFVLLVPSILLVDGLTEKRRKKAVRAYKLKKDLKAIEKYDMIFRSYIIFGPSNLHKMNDLFHNRESLKRILALMLLRRKEAEALKPLYTKTSNNESDISIEDNEVFNDLDSNVEKLYQQKIIDLKKGELFVDEGFVELLGDFMLYLEII
jgi:hypothetical protein